MYFDLVYFNFYRQQIMNISQKCFGNTLFNLVVKPTIYDGFAAGYDDASLKNTAVNLAKANIRLMAITGLEEDVGESLDGEE